MSLRLHAGRLVRVAAAQLRALSSLGVLSLCLGQLGCGASIYLAAGDGAMSRGDAQGALESYVAAREWDRDLMTREEIKLLHAKLATASRALLTPALESACNDAKQGAPALSRLLPIFFGESGIAAALSTEEKAALNRRALACIGKAMRSTIGYHGLAPTTFKEIRKLVGRVAMLRKQLRLSNHPDKAAKADINSKVAREQLSAVLRSVATPGLSGMWGVCDALAQAGRPFEALEFGRVTLVTTGKGAKQWRALRTSIAERLRTKANAAVGHPDLKRMLRALAIQADRGLLEANANTTSANKVKSRPARPLEPIAWQVGSITATHCSPDVVKNLQWRLPTNSHSPHLAIVDVQLSSCVGDEKWHVSDRKVRVKQRTDRDLQYRHTFNDYTTTYECELTNTIESRTCEVNGKGSHTEIACKTKSTLEKICSPTAHPLETTRVVTKRTTRFKSRKIRRRVHEANWTFAIRGQATVRWGERSVEIPVDVRVKRSGEWWSDKHGKQAKPDMSKTRIRQLAVEKVVAVIHRTAMTIMAPAAHAATSAARMADHHKHENAWADHTLRAARMGIAPDTDQLARIGRLVGLPRGHYVVALVAPGRNPEHRVKAGMVMAELYGGDVRLKPGDQQFAMPKPRRDRFVENLRSIVQGPIVMPRQNESHYEVTGWLGPSPLDSRRIVPRILAKARLSGWFGLGFGGDLEALGQGTRGWMAEVSMGPTLSDDFAFVEVFGRVRQHRLLPRSDNLGLPQGPASLDNVDLGLRASTGGPFGVYLDAAFNAFGLTTGDGVLRNHPISLGAQLDLRVISAQAGVTYWFGEEPILTYQGGIGLRL